MYWLTAVGFGACGGAVVQAITTSASVHAWHAARLGARLKKQPLPTLTSYLDPPADVLVLVTRMSLGAIAGILFHAQVSGATAAIVVGASAPALLRQFGAARSLAELDSDEGTDSAAAASQSVAGLDSTLAEDG